MVYFTRLTICPHRVIPALGIAPSSRPMVVEVTIQSVPNSLITPLLGIAPSPRH